MQVSPRYTETVILPLVDVPALVTGVGGLAVVLIAVAKYFTVSA